MAAFRDPWAHSTYRSVALAAGLRPESDAGPRTAAAPSTGTDSNAPLGALGAILMALRTSGDSLAVMKVMGVFYRALTSQG